MKIRHLHLYLLFCTTTLVCGAVYAGPVTFIYAGHVTQTPAFDPIDPFAGLVHPAIYDPITQQLIDPATTFSGHFTFDSATADAIPADPKTGSYESVGTPYDFTLDIAGFHFAYGGNAIAVGVQYPFPVGDFFGVTSLPIASDNFLEIFLATINGNAFADDALPTSPFDIVNLFPQRDFHFGWAYDTVDQSNNPIFVQVQFDGSLDALTVPEPVPEPESLLLFMTGLSILIARQLAGHRRIEA
jgi:hypothetical protein